MKYALVILEDHVRDRSSKQAVENTVNQLLTQIKGIEEVQTFQILNEGAILFPLEHGLHALSLCISVAKHYGIHSRTLFFDQEPSWVVTS